MSHMYVIGKLTTLFDKRAPHPFNFKNLNNIGY